MHHPRCFTRYRVDAPISNRLPSGCKTVGTEKYAVPIAIYPIRNLDLNLRVEKKIRAIYTIWNVRNAIHFNPMIKHVNFLIRPIINLAFLSSVKTGDGMRACARSSLDSLSNYYFPWRIQFMQISLGADFVESDECVMRKMLIKMIASDKSVKGRARLFLSHCLIGWFRQRSTGRFELNADISFFCCLNQ